VEQRAGQSILALKLLEQARQPLCFGRAMRAIAAC
jgi:hypothetical protein